MMLYYLYRAGSCLAKAFPNKVCYAIADLIARIYYSISGADRASIRENLKVVLGPGVEEKVMKRHVLSLFRNFAKYLVDFFKFPRFTREEVFGRVKISGIERLDKCLSQGKGVILVSMHLGNWEMAGAVLGALGYAVNAIALEHGNKKVNDFFVSQRAINGLKVIPLGIQVKQCFKVLKRNEILGIIGDKDYTSNGEYVDFFGKKALIPKGPAVFALRTGAPIVVCAFIRNPDDSFEYTFETPEEYEPSGDESRDIEALMGGYIRIMESFIKEHPDQWYAFRRVWEQETTTR